MTPWAAVRLLKPAAHHDHGEEDRFTRLYRRVMGPLIASGRMRALFLAGVAVLLLAAMALVPLKLVTVKMLPFDNKSEFQVMVDMPEGTALEDDGARRVRAWPRPRWRTRPSSTCSSTSARRRRTTSTGSCGTTSCAARPHLADLQVNLVPKGERSAQSHDVARRVRDRLLPIARSFGATMQVAEVPPGPPVLQTLVAEVYGPDATRRTDVAAQVKAIFEQTPGVVDTDWYVEAPHRRSRSPWMARRPPRPDCRRPPWRRSSGWPVRARSSDCCTMPRRAKTSRSSFACRAPTAASRRFSRCG